MLVVIVEPKLWFEKCLKFLKGPEHFLNVPRLYNITSWLVVEQKKLNLKFKQTESIFFWERVGKKFFPFFVFTTHLAWFDDEKSATTNGHVDNYSAERKESMLRQVTQLHQHSEESRQVNQEFVSQEAQEWQTMAKKERHVTSASFAQHHSASTTITMVNINIHIPNCCLVSLGEIYVLNVSVVIGVPNQLKTSNYHQFCKSYKDAGLEVWSEAVTQAT